MLPHSAQWSVLDTAFDSGSGFVRAWLHWRDHPHSRPGLLHWVALCPAVPSLQTVLAHVPQRAQELAAELQSHWYGWLPGFHRLILEGGHVCLTLCVGDHSQELLRQQQFQADEVRLAWPQDLLAQTDAQATTWWVKNLARCCRRGTRVRLCAGAAPASARAALSSAGFRFGPDADQAVFDPAWSLKTRTDAPAAVAAPAHCIVVGAGLAGAATAASLARRGWRVTVVDRAEQPAAGASGLPVGLMVPHTSRDDCPLSRLSRAGVRMMWAQAHALLQAGVDWAPSTVVERQIGGTPQLPHGWANDARGADWSRPVADDTPLAPALLHPRAAWVRPSALVAAWLRHPAIEFRGGVAVDHVQPTPQGWRLVGEGTQTLPDAPLVVLANAGGTREALQKTEHNNADLSGLSAHLLPMQGMRGLLTWGWHAQTALDAGRFPETPVNGSGSVIAHIPGPEGLFWCTGSSYQPDWQPERPQAANHHWNLRHLRELLPDLARALEHQFPADEHSPLPPGSVLRAWTGVRCVSRDRLPLVGPVAPDRAAGLWVYTGMGSRGLSFSVLGAELLAAQLHGEPLPVPAPLARALSAQRR